MPSEASLSLLKPRTNSSSVFWGSAKLEMEPPNFLVVTFPSQGHINPSLRFSESLVRNGCHVTFTTTLSTLGRIANSNTPTLEGLSFAAFSDGYDDGIKEGEVDLEVYMEEISRRGPETLRELVLDYHNRGTNFTCVFFTTLVPWVADVAHSLCLRSTLLWVQPATVFNIYYYYFNGYDWVIRSIADTAAADVANPLEIRLPGMIPMTSDYVPSFLTSGNQYAFSVPLIRRHFEILNSEKIGTMKPKVLVNTFEELEPEAVRAVHELDLIPVGPFIPSGFLEGHDSTDASFGGNLLKNSSDQNYIDWLNKMPAASVIYISFGSLYLFSGRQKEEMAKALIVMGRPFLWVIRKRAGREVEKDDKMICEEELSKLGMIVPWCSQVEVLSNPSVGCYVTHCGWNSTVESLASGVPMVAFPQWSDQRTNAKLVEDVWRTGVRVGEGNREGVVEAGEIERCLEVVLGDGEKGRELRENAKKWGESAKKAAKLGGSSDNNLRRFINILVKETTTE